MSEISPASIDPLRLRPLLEEAFARFDLVALVECPSTNTALMRRAAEGAASGTVIVADRQTAGRGSRGRSWAASPGASLTFSVLWDFPGDARRLSGLSLAVGVAVVRALARVGASVMLKWPNDVLHGEAKLGGILVELCAGNALTRAVVGIGLNLRLPENVGEAHAAALPAAALEQIVAALPDRHFLFAALLIELARVFDAFDAEGFAALRDAWQGVHAWQGRPVRLLRGESVEAQGVCEGADVDGALLVRTAEGLVRCFSGDVTLRPR